MLVNKKSITEAAESIYKEGGNPSVKRVQKRLGRGSYTTIAPIIREWKKSKREQLKAITDAADSIYSEGVEPTVVSVNKKLGKGSFSTITPILKEWKDNKKDYIEADANMENAMKEAIVQSSSELWAVASNLIHKRLEAERASQQSLINLLISEYDDMRQMLDSLETQNKQISKELKRAKMDLKKEKTLTAKLNKMISNKNLK